MCSYGIGFRTEDLRFEIWGLRFRINGLGRVEGILDWTRGRQRKWRACEQA